MAAAGGTAPKVAAVAAATARCAGGTSDDGTVAEKMAGEAMAGRIPGGRTEPKAARTDRSVARHTTAFPTDSSRTASHRSAA